MLLNIRNSTLLRLRFKYEKAGLSAQSYILIDLEDASISVLMTNGARDPLNMPILRIKPPAKKWIFSILIFVFVLTKFLCAVDKKVNINQLWRLRA